MNLFERLKNVKKQPGPSISAPHPLLLSQGQERSSRFGKYILLQKEIRGAFYFPAFASEPAPLHTNLQLIPGIGPVTEERLRQQGYASLTDLLEHPYWQAGAGRIIRLIKNKKVRELQSLGADTWTLLSYFKPEEILFFDLETTGLWTSQPLFLIGLLFYRQGKFIIYQLLARTYSEEKAVIAAADEVFRRFKVLVSYNGKRFDLPYVTERSIEHRLFYTYPHYHVDLLGHARRRFKNSLPNCKLVTLEENLLRFQRLDDLPGCLIPETYHRFAKEQDEALIAPILKHNRLDLL